MKKFFFILLFILAGIHPLLAQQVYQAHTYARLVTEQNAVYPGGKFWVGIDLVPEPGWHLYWKNPGDSGFSPRAKWALPPGFKAGDIQWPYPQRMTMGPLAVYGYDREVILLVPVWYDPHFGTYKNINLHAHLDWLACRDICVPGKAELDLPLTVVNDASGVRFNAYQDYFNKTKKLLPQWFPGITSQVVLDGDHWLLNIQSSLKGPQEIAFYPFRDDVIEHAAPQVVKSTPFGYQVVLTKSHLYQGHLTALNGIAVNLAGWDKYGRTHAINIQAPIGKSPVSHVPILLACLFALIGGLILNLMPCVLPVLSIKVLHLVERHPDKRVALRHSLVYALGILVSVWALGLLLFILKSAGEFAGWGFQFQSPVFVIAVALVLFALALNLFGVFEFSTPSISGIKPPMGGYQDSFISGIITTIVATPCTAPFMGTALTVAISQPNMVGFLIFTFLGLGLALPFVLLSAFPTLLAFIPKPGPWMIILKRVLGIVLLLCVVWLLWVLGIQTGAGDFTKFYKPSEEIHWQKYSQAAVNQARQRGQGVFIDFTAAWCINCQVNDRLVLQNHQVVKAFKDHKIEAFKADWTKYDPAVTQGLGLYGRDSIPVYVYYPPGCSDNSVVLPQLITPNMILKRIGAINSK